MARSLSLVAVLLIVATLLFLCNAPQRQDSRDVLDHFTRYRVTKSFQARDQSESKTAPSPHGRGALRESSRSLDEAEPSPESLHDLGLRRLAERRYREALLTLESLSLQPGAGGAALSDLAAVYLERGQAEGRPFDFVLALSAAHRALAAQPRLAEALFNRAEALSQLQLARQAQTAWEAYLQVDPVSPWSQEARDRLRELAEPALDELWQQELPRLEVALARQNLSTVHEIVSSLPFRSRLYGEEKVLGEWAAGGPPAGRLDRLAAARALGQTLQSQTRDAMLADAVAAIDQAHKHGDLRTLSALLQGHREFSRAVVLYRSQDCAQARPQMLSAESALESAGSPFAGWAALDAAACELYSSAERALPRLEMLRRSYDAQRYPELTARIEWALGLAKNNLGRSEQALGHYRTAFERLDASVGPQASGFVHLLLAEAYQGLGQLDRAWEERLLTIAWCRRQGDPQRIQATLYDAADRLLDQGFPEPALDFAEELLLNAEAYGQPGALAEARLQRGRSLAALGRRSEALEDLRAARDFATSMPAGAVSERIRSTLELVEGEELAERDPTGAVQLLSRALTARLGQGYRYRLLPLLTSRARAYQKLNDLPHAEDDLRFAIEEQEQARSEVQDLDLRLSSFQQAQAAFDAMVRLQVEHYRDDAKALEYAERARSRLLLDLIAGKAASRLPRALRASSILTRLPASTVLVEYFVLPERLLAWVVRSGTIHRVEMAVPERELDREMRILRTAMERRAQEGEIRSAASSLFETLIRPLAAELSGAGALVVVPDRSLVQVPFAALFDARQSRYLVEDHTLIVAPSATLYLTALDRLSRFAGEMPRDALVIGDPAFDRQRYPHLNRLSAAATEATEIATLYERTELLLGGNATRGAFLESAPGHRIVHFAGHALLQPLSPGLSLLLFAPGNGAAGPLFARDLAGYRLDNTEMVVLSACRTLDDAAASRESLVGLAAAFLAAGPPVVVSSLWQVEDRATRELMLAFHRVFRKGADPAAALRAAQLELLHASPTGPFRSPAFWAGFEVFGAGK